MSHQDIREYADQLRELSRDNAVLLRRMSKVKSFLSMLRARARDVEGTMRSSSLVERRIAAKGRFSAMTTVIRNLESALEIGND